jgi:zinc protease
MKVSKALLEQLGITFVKEARGIAEYKLNSNGLRIILAENHASPVVTVMPLYRVGSRNEAVGFTGATHILEHMMFKSVKNGRTGEIYSFDDVVRPIGGVFNATTWLDRTNYFETVGKEHLEACIALESDRLRNLVLNDEERASEMTVVRNELERGQNEPMRVLMEEAYAVAFREHPYHHPTIGWVSDVENISIERLKQFYDQFYWPDNTTLLLMGDFESEQALTWVQKYYGVYPRAPKALPKVYTTEPRQEGPRTFTINRPGDAPHLVLAFRTPEAAHHDTHALSAAAQLLGGSRKTSRLYKALVEKGLASDVEADHMQHRDPGLFLVMATAAPGVEIAAVEQAILDELRNLGSKPASDAELTRAKTAYSKRAKLAAADPMRMASQIAEAEAVADWTFYVDFDEKFSAVKPEDVQRVAAQYFIEDSKTTGYFMPKHESAEPVAEESADASVPACPRPVTVSSASRVN